MPLVILVPNPAAGLPAFHEVPKYFWDSLLCILSMNSVTCDPAIACFGPCTPDGLMSADCCTPDCCDLKNAWAWLEIMLFVFFDALYNVFALMIVRSGSAALMFAASALTIPTTAIFFQWKWLAGYFQEHLNVYNYVGVAIIVTGVVIYRIYPETEIESGVAAAVRPSAWRPWRRCPYWPGWPPPRSPGPWRRRATPARGRRGRRR